MKGKKWFVLLASLALVLLASSIGVTRSSLVDLESSTGNTFQAWTSREWVQTTEAEFNAGVLDNVDTSSSPGDVKLAITSSWYDESWSRRAPITISNSGSGLTDYQVKVDVTYDADMQPDFDDIRFADSDGLTLIAHWRESHIASTSATFWVKVPSIPSGTKTIYMYYGNSAASSESSKENTMGIVDVHVGADADDGEEDGRVFGTNAWKTDGYYGGGENKGFFGYYETYDSPFEPGFRFDNITCSGIVTNAYLKLYFISTGHLGSPENPLTTTGGYLYGIDEADPVAWDFAHRPSVRTTTTAKISWNKGYCSGWHESPDIKTIVQELVDSYTYTGTQAMAFYWREDTWTQGTYAMFELYGHVGGHTPTLHIEYRKYASPEPTASVGPEEGMYISSGTIASQVLDTGVAGARWDALFWDETLPSNTDITFEVRASDTLTAGFPDASWVPVGGISPVTSGLPSGRYMQWRATLTTLDTSKTPTLHEVRVYHY